MPTFGALARALPLRGLADAINVTDGASARAHLSAPLAAAILAREGLEPVLQFTCRDRNRIALEGELMGAAACGIRNILCLTGDDPKAGDQPETKAVFDLDSAALTRIARDLRDKAELPLRKAYGMKQEDEDVNNALRRIGVVPGPGVLDQSALAKPIIPRGPRRTSTGRSRASRRWTRSRSPGGCGAWRATRACGWRCPTG